MKRTLLAAGLLCLALGGGCGPREYGKDAPAFGDSPAHSTTAGFLVGRWEAKMDESTARYKQPSLVKAVLPNMVLEFKPDHTAEFTVDHITVNMRWKEDVNGVALEAVDVEGVSADKVHTAYEAYMNSPHGRLRPGGNDAYMRGAALDLAQMVKRLELMPDGRRLFEPDTVRSDGTSFMGTKTWVRVH